MLKCLFFCCHEKEKEPNTVSLEDVINLKEKKQENINYTTQDNNNNQNNIEENYNNNNDNNSNNNEIENKNFYQNGVLLNNNGLFINENNLYNNNNTSPSPPILTINNINNINISLHRNSYSKEPTKLLGKKDSESDTPKNCYQTIISVDNSCDQNKYKSFISFSNLTVKYNNNNNNVGGSSINFSDTEIMSSCEISLTGDIFFNKEIKLDRCGIKNPLITTNRYKNKKKACELKFGVSSNVSNISSSSVIGKITDEKNNNKNSSKNVNIVSKNNKKISVKGNQKKKMQSISSLTSVNNNSNINYKNIDVVLNLSYSKIQKKINESSLINNNNDNYILFILKYDTSMDMFQLISTQESIPLELLLNYNYPLRFQQNYHILVGAVTIKMKVIKNEKNESLLNVAVLFEEENNENKEEKNEIVYKFNPFVDKMPITIGRVNCDININNISVSKLHAQVDYVFDYDEYFITDCKSTNGTYLLLRHSLNSIYIKRDHYLKIFESKFKIHYVNFDL